jgi:hypothetical protein
MRSWVGYRQIGIAVELAARLAGDSKCGVLKYLKLASDAIFSFSTVPIRAAALSGFSPSFCPSSLPFTPFSQNLFFIRTLRASPR